MLRKGRNRLQQSKHNKGQNPKHIIQAQSTRNHSRIHSIFLQRLALLPLLLLPITLALRPSERWSHCDILYSGYHTCDFLNYRSSQLVGDCSCDQPRSRILQLYILCKLLPALCRGCSCQQLEITNTSSQYICRCTLQEMQLHNVEL